MRRPPSWLLALALALALLAGCAAQPEPEAPAAHAPPSAAHATGDAGAAVSAAEAARLARWQRLGYGMFVHWGLYSVLGGVWHGEPVTRGYSEQIQSWARIPAAEYARVADGFSAPRFDPDAICALARDAGARYVVVTAKHHDGFAMFDTATTDFDIVDRTPFGRDPLKLLSEACRRQGLGFGIYFSLVDWHAGHAFDPDNGNPIPASMEPLVEGQLRELMSHYGPLVEVWFDMSTPTPAQSRRLKAIVRELQPQAAINGRIWNNQGDFVTLGDNQAPPPSMQPPFEVPASIYHATWGYRSWQVREDAAGKVRELVRGLVAARAAGGNYLLNIGPRGDGSVVPFEEEVLRGIGAWLRRHPGALLDAGPAGLPPQRWGAAMRRGDALFLHVRDWRGGELRVEGLASDPREVRIDGRDGAALPWRRDGDDVLVGLPDAAPDPVLPVLRLALAGPLRVRPAGTVRLDAAGDARLPASGWRAGTSYAYGSGYRSQRATRVSWSASVQAPRPLSAWLRLRGAHARDGRRYRVAVGATVHEVEGARLATQAVGPFPLPGDAAVPVSIRLADPAWPAEDIGLAFDGAALCVRCEGR